MSTEVNPIEFNGIYTQVSVNCIGMQPLCVCVSMLVRHLFINATQASSLRYQLMIWREGCGKQFSLAIQKDIIILLELIPVLVMLYTRLMQS